MRHAFWMCMVLILLAIPARAVGPGPGDDWVEFRWQGLTVWAPPQWVEVVATQRLYLISYSPEEAESTGELADDFTFAAGFDPQGFSRAKFEAQGDTVNSLGEVEVTGTTVELFEVVNAEMFLLACHVTTPLPNGMYLGMAFGATPTADRNTFLPLFERMLYTITLDLDEFTDTESDTTQGGDNG
ncbi:MAG: hypothetical protein D6E12_14975 [Desulfovibrio sp.]|nr:MAG: hypothetical protein D6E12_14975 [Desulfovibrio sp.]